MKTARVLFLISRTHGLQAHLLKTQDFLRLLATRNVGEMGEFLMNSDYASEVSRSATAELTALQLEKVFYEKLSARWYSLLRITSGGIKKLLEAYSSRLEIENLKTIIRAVHGKARIGDEQLVGVPREYQKVNFHALLVTETIAELLELLRETPYEDVAESMVEYEKYKSPMVFEARLDKEYYGNLWAMTHGMPDQRKLRGLLGTEVDMRNLRFIIASKYMSIEDPQLIWRNVIDPGFRLPRTVVSKLIHADVREISKVPIWPSYSELLRKATELGDLDQIVEMESIFSRYLYSYVDKTRIRNPNSFVYVFSYLQMCLREARNLTTLALGKQMKISESELNSLLFL